MTLSAKLIPAHSHTMKWSTQQSKSSCSSGACNMQYDMMREQCIASRHWHAFNVQYQWRGNITLSPCLRPGSVEKAKVDCTYIPFTFLKQIHKYIWDVKNISPRTVRYQIYCEHILRCGIWVEWNMTMWAVLTPELPGKSPYDLLTDKWVAPVLFPE